jgi:hypothetical protein
MTAVREPILKPVAISELRPTQITVGMREVDMMQKRWRARSAKKDGVLLGRHMIPVVLGPSKRHYIIDHHHFCRALYEQGQTHVLVAVVAKLDRLEREQFWFVLDNRGWMHPFDEKGRRRHYSDIPKSVADLVDDPFRSLAGELRRAGGFAKDTTPFSEFLWADFLRRRLKPKHVKSDFERSLKKALRLAKGEDADYLPGWCGPVARE